MRYSKLHVSRLNADQHSRCCGYWYCVQSNFAAHTAFRSRAALDLWMGRLGLSLGAAEIGNWTPIIGEYIDQAHGCTLAEFREIPGERFPQMSNGSYTDGVVTIGADGVHTLHTMGPNCNDRRIWNYQDGDRANFQTWNHPDPHAPLAAVSA